MKIKKISLFDSIYWINKNDLVVEHGAITGLEFIPSFSGIGDNERVSAIDSTLKVEIEYKKHIKFFGFDKDGNIIPEDDFYFDKSIAMEELIIAKTNDSRIESD